MTRVFGYRAPAARWVLPLVFTILGAVALGLVVALAMNSGPPRLFAGLWIVALIWNAYWFLWRFGHSIEVDGTRVTWRAVLRRREVDLADLTGNGVAWIGFERIRVRGAPSLLVLTTDRSWLRFIDAMNAAHPAHPFVRTRSPRSLVWQLQYLTGYYERLE